MSDSNQVLRVVEPTTHIIFKTSNFFAYLVFLFFLYKTLTKMIKFYIYSIEIC